MPGLSTCNRAYVARRAHRRFLEETLPRVARTSRALRLLSLLVESGVGYSFLWVRLPGTPSPRPYPRPPTVSTPQLNIVVCDLYFVLLPPSVSPSGRFVILRDVFVCGVMPYFIVRPNTIRCVAEILMRQGWGIRHRTRRSSLFASTSIALGEAIGRGDCQARCTSPLCGLRALGTAIRLRSR